MRQRGLPCAVPRFSWGTHEFREGRRTSALIRIPDSNRASLHFREGHQARPAAGHAQEATSHSIARRAATTVLSRLQWGRGKNTLIGISAACSLAGVIVTRRNIFADLRAGVFHQGKDTGRSILKI